MKLIVPLLGLFALVLASTPALAQGCCSEGDAPPASQGESTDQATGVDATVHGGSLTGVGVYRFESVLRKEGVRVYVFDKSGRPLKVSKLSGRVTHSPVDGEETLVDLKPVEAGSKGGQGYLLAKLSLDFESEARQGLTVNLTGLGETGEDAARFEVPFKRSPKVGYVCPMHAKVRSDDPGRCPECGMKLSRKVKKEAPVAARSAAIFTCSMHPQVAVGSPGTCPICRMKLVPKQAERTTKPAESVAYTCPMHPDVRTTAPGRCPKCGMALKKSGSAGG